MKKNSLTKWLFVFITLMFLGLGGYIGYQYYQSYLANKIYSAGETIDFPDFNIVVTRAEFQGVDLPINKEEAKKYGGVDKYEDCKQKSDKNTWTHLKVPGYDPQWVNYGLSDRQVCQARNDSRGAIKKYSDANSQLVIDYKITGKGYLNTSRLNMDLVVDSGRKLSVPVDDFTFNQFLNSSGPQYLETVFNDYEQPPGPVYSRSPSVDYTPYHSSKLGGDINKGIERTGYIYTDIRKSENIVDLKISYSNATRIVRFTK